MAILEMRDLLDLVGNQLKDGSEQSERFRRFIEQEKWPTHQLRTWLDECVQNSSGSHDPYNRAFQDLVVSLGSRLGFSVEYGLYAGKPGADNYDGIWKRSDRDIIVIEVKTSTWPIQTVGQLGEYVAKLSKRDSEANVFGLFVIGKGDVRPLVEQILGSNYKDRLRLIQYTDLVDLIQLAEDLELAVGKMEALSKLQSLVFPVQAIDIGNLVRLVIDISSLRTETPDMEGDNEAEEEKTNEAWQRDEFISYLDTCTPLQSLFLAALVQLEEPVRHRSIVPKMNEIASRRRIEGLPDKIERKMVPGSLAGLTLRRKRLGKEEFLHASWESQYGDYIWTIAEPFRGLITEWVKKHGLWVEE